MTKSIVVSSVAAYPCVHNNPSQVVNSPLTGMLRVGFCELDFAYYPLKRHLLLAHYSLYNLFTGETFSTCARSLLPAARDLAHVY